MKICKEFIIVLFIIILTQGCVKEIEELIPAELQVKAGTIDVFFGSVFTDFNQTYNTALKILVQDDDKIIILGYTGYMGNEHLNHIIRLLPDGTYDSSFGTNGKLTFQLGTGSSEVSDMALQSDGKIVVVGTDFSENTYNIAIARFSTDGNFDQSFGTNGIEITDLGQQETGTSVMVQDDGKIVVAGYISYGGDNNMDAFVYRYNQDGSTDWSFSAGHIVVDINNNSYDLPKGIVMHNNKILFCSVVHANSYRDYDGVALIQLNMDGSFDTNFGVNGISLFDGLTISDGLSFVSPITDIAITPDNKIVASCYINGIAGNDFAVFRFNANGIPDNSFGNYGLVVTDMPGSNIVYSIAVQSDGKILAGGSALANSNYNSCLIRYMTNGDLDTDFAEPTGIGIFDISKTPDSPDWITTICIQNNGRILAAGTADNENGDPDIVITRFNAGPLNIY